MSSKIESIKPNSKCNSNTSKILQNYSKMLQNFASNPMIASSKSKASESAMINRKASHDLSISNQSKIISEKKLEHTSRSPLTSGRNISQNQYAIYQESTSLKKSARSALPARNHSMGNISQMYNSNLKISNSALENSAAEIQVSQKKTTILHKKAVSIDVSANNKKIESKSSTKKLMNTPYFQLHLIASGSNSAANSPIKHIPQSRITKRETAHLDLSNISKQPTSNNIQNTLVVSSRISKRSARPAESLSQNNSPISSQRYLTNKWTQGSKNNISYVQMDQSNNKLKDKSSVLMEKDMNKKIQEPPKQYQKKKSVDLSCYASSSSKDSSKNLTKSLKKLLNNSIYDPAQLKINNYLSRPRTSNVDISDVRKINLSISTLDKSKCGNLSRVESRIENRNEYKLESRKSTAVDISQQAKQISEAEMSLKPYLDKAFNHSAVKSSENRPPKPKSIIVSRELSPKNNHSIQQECSNSRRDKYSIVTENDPSKANIQISPRMKMIINSSLKEQEKKCLKNNGDDDFEIIPESMRVYLELNNNMRKKEQANPSNKSPNFFKDNSKSLVHISPRKLDFEKIEVVSLSPKPVQTYGQAVNKNSQKIDIRQTGENNENKREITENSSYNNGGNRSPLVLANECLKNMVNKPQHKKNSKSASTVNHFDQVIKGLNLPINVSNLNKENIITPTVSDPNSNNNTTANISKNNNNNSTANLNASRNLSNPKLIPDDTIDDAYLKERLVKNVSDNFRLRNACPSTTLDYYRLIKMIGKGAFGKVYLGVHLLTGKHVAIKSIEKQYMRDEHSRKKIFQEVMILKKTNHKNIIRLLEVFENKKYLFMVLEYACNGDLLGYVKKRMKLTEDDAKRIFLQITHGVRYCHHNLILHRDIKLDNILLDENFDIKICDFGVSRFIKKGQIIHEQCGTPAYIAPEIIKDKGYEGCYADIWSMGVLLFAMVTGTVPFKANNLEELHTLILAGKFTTPSFLSEEVRDLISKMLKLNPYSRISIDDIAEHPWFKNNSENDFYRNLLTPVRDEKGFDQEFKRFSSINGTLESENTIQLIDSVIRKVEKLGYPRDFIIKSINQNSCNHPTSCYLLLYREFLSGNQ